MEGLGEECLEKVAMGGWGLWKARCSLLFEGNEQSSVSVVEGMMGIW